MELFKGFRGREPKIDALLRHSGMMPLDTLTAEGDQDRANLLNHSVPRLLIMELRQRETKALREGSVSLHELQHLIPSFLRSSNGIVARDHNSVHRILKGAVLHPFEGEGDLVRHLLR